MRWLRRLGIGALVVGVLVLLGTWWLFGGVWRRLEYIEATPSAGFHSGFYLYASPSASAKAARGEKVVILVQPNNSGVNSDDQEVHRRDAWWTSFGRQSVANELGVVLLVPAFPRPAKDWKVYTHALDRDTFTTDRPDLRRLDLQLISMIDHARDTLRRRKMEADERVLIQGFSASGMFANRFAALHPERVIAVAAGAPGGWPIAPVGAVSELALPYPAGIADLESLSGEPFDLDGYRGVSQLIYMGSKDDNDSLDFEDGWEKPIATELQNQFGDTPLARWKAAEALYQEAGANAKFVLIEGEGHNRRRLQYLATEFFKQVLTERK